MALEYGQTVDGLLLNENKLAIKAPRPNFGSITEVGSFQPQKVIAGEGRYAVPGRRMGTRRAIGIWEFLGHVGPAVPSFVVFERARQGEALLCDLFSDFGTSGTIESARQKVAIPVETTDDARRRLVGYEKLAERIYSLTQDQLLAFGTTGRILVRPAWSHEYYDSAGVVFDVNIITADDNLRFSLWDTISQKLAELPGISEDEKQFLHNNISLFVTARG
jgi:hypothetical protein